MSDLNKAILIGRLGKDPESRSTSTGQQVANFSIATSEKWTDKGGQKQEKTEWHNLVAWGKLAEIVSKYLHKGSQVFIEGKLQTRSWDDKEGNKKYTTEIVVSNLQMLGGEKREQGAPGAGAAHVAPGGQPEDCKQQPVNNDLPF